MKSLGLYIHIPFCRSKCYYCDFCSFPQYGESDFEAYVSSLCRDLEACAADCGAYAVDTVYFGGGTPTLLPWRLLKRVLDCIVRCYRVAPDAEVTLECNPKTASPEQLRALKNAGFNRLSIGMQSTHDNELRALGRIHSFADFVRTFADARTAGFENISADLMMGIPEQSLSSYLESVERLCALQPEHISSYGLIVEDGTPFGDRREQLILPDEDAEQEMYFGGIELLRKNGYRQYEISNFARPGYESRHNLRYWNCEAFLGFGPAAYSDFEGERFGNSRDLAAYLAGESIVSESERPTRSQRMNEYVMLQMRLAKGVCFSDFSSRFGKSFEEVFGKRLCAPQFSRFLVRGDDRIAFTAEGMRVSNAILSELLSFDD